MPEGILSGRAAPAPASPGDGGAPAFQRPQEVPFSELADELITTWMPKPKPGQPMEGEHKEVTGQSGSGKSYYLATLLHMRALKRDTPTIYICTKQDDPTVRRLVELGWPLVSTWDEVRRERQCIFWPQTKQLGEGKDKFFEERIYDLLTRLWRKNANTIVVFDEVGYVEGLSRRIRKLVRQYWREARALGISVVASKQRPVGVARDQHSESRWKAVFPPADQGDMQRFAELLGSPRDWAPVLQSLDQEQHQFVLRNNVLKAAYITWVDFALEDLRKLTRRTKTAGETLYGQQQPAQ